MQLPSMLCRSQKQLSSVPCRSAISGFLDDIMVPIGIPAHIHSSSKSLMSSLYFVSFKEAPKVTEKAEVGCWNASQVKPSTLTVWTLWLHMDSHPVCSSSVSSLLAARHGAAACHVACVDFLQLSTGLQPLMSLCTHPAACKLCREQSKLEPCMPAATSPRDGSLYVACMQLRLFLHYSSSTLQL